MIRSEDFYICKIIKKEESMNEKRSKKEAEPDFSSLLISPENKRLMNLIVSTVKENAYLITPYMNEMGKKWHKLKHSLETEIDPRDHKFTRDQNDREDHKFTRDQNEGEDIIIKIENLDDDNDVQKGNNNVNAVQSQDPMPIDTKNKGNSNDMSIDHSNNDKLDKQMQIDNSVEKINQEVINNSQNSQQNNNWQIKGKKVNKKQTIKKRQEEIKQRRYTRNTKNSKKTDIYCNNKEQKNMISVNCFVITKKGYFIITLRL